MVDQNTTRRTLLGTAGSIVATGSLAATAGAKGRGKAKGRHKDKGGGPPDHAKHDRSNGRRGPPQNAKNTCPEGSVLLAKYEVEGGRFVYEKDSDYLEVGDAFEFNVTNTKDGGEVLGFMVDDPSGVYDMHELSVKTGEGVFRKSVEGTPAQFDATDYDESGPVQAISNVLICARVWWQVDFGRGEVPVPPNYDEMRDDSLVLAATGDCTTESIINPSFDRDNERGPVEVPDDEFEIDLAAGTVSVDFENNEERLHLASFETPGKYDGEEVAYQDLFDVKYTTATSGTLTAEIPRPDDYV